jgi:hypothetical protein
MDIDEPGGDHEPGRVDLARCDDGLGRPRRLGAFDDAGDARPGAPVPSTSVPLRMTMSASM